MVSLETMLRSDFESCCASRTSNNDGIKETTDWALRLCEAASTADVDKLREYVVSGAPVNKGDYDNRTAMHLAASEGLVEVVKFLILEAEAYPNPVDRWGFSPMDDAMRHKHVEVVEFLKDNGGLLFTLDSSQPSPRESYINRAPLPTH